MLYLSGQNTAIIGEVTAEKPEKALMETAIEGIRIVDMLSGESLIRIC